jgi:tripartite-type tricarboxylate transporter receptor subunit TctC
LIDLMGGRLSLGFVSIPAAQPHIQSGRLAALGSSDRKRSSNLPDVPAIAETVPGYELFTWYGFFAPAGVSAAILEKAGAEARAMLQDPENRQKLQAQGFDAVGNSPAEAAAFIRKESAVFSKIVNAANLRSKTK